MKLYKDADNNVFAYEIDGSQDYLIGDKVGITPEEAQQIEANATASRFNAMSYDQKRALSYPSMAEQLDMLYWDGVNGTTTWADAIAAVKAKHPKGV